MKILRSHVKCLRYISVEFFVRVSESQCLTWFTWEISNLSIEVSSLLEQLALNIPLLPAHHFASLGDLRAY